MQLVRRAAGRWPLAHTGKCPTGEDRPQAERHKATNNIHFYVEECAGTLVVVPHTQRYNAQQVHTYTCAAHIDT